MCFNEVSLFTYWKKFVNIFINTKVYKSYLNTGSPKIVLSVPNEEKFVEILDQTKNIFKV